MRIQKALNRFVVQLQADGRSPHTIRQYSRHVRLFARWRADVARCGDRIDGLDHEDVARFLASREANRRPDGQPKKATAMNCLRSSLKGFFHYLHQAGYLTNDPGQLIRRAVCSPAPPRGLSDEDQRRLLRVLSRARGPQAERDHVLFHLMLTTGVRLGSALGIDVEDVRIDESEILLRSTKGNHPETIFLGRSIRNHLARFLKGRLPGPLFAGDAGRRLSTRHVQRRLSVWLKRAAVEAHASPHSLRHAFAMGLYRRTGDILLVKEALRHRSIGSTLVYAHADQDRLRQALEA